MSTSKVTTAKKFIIASVLDQAKRDGVSLTDVEIRMLGFAEATASEKDMKAAQVFQREYDDEEYEIKIAELLRSAYGRDRTNEDTAAAWDYAVADLEDEDMYLKVMLDLAGISGSARPELVDWRFILAIAPAAILLTAGIVVGFTPIGARLIPNDTLRLTLFLFLTVLPILLSKFRHRQRD